MRRAEPPTPDHPPDGTGPAPERSVIDNVMRNLGHLLAGRVASALLLLVAMSLMARSLTPADFGLVVLLQTYVLAWNGLFNCKPFEAVIRFGIPALEQSDTPRLARLLSLSLWIDAASSLGAAVAGFAFAGLIGRLLGWEPSIVVLAQAWSLVAISGMTGTAKGVLRLFDRFDLLSRQLAIGPAMRCAGVVVVVALDGGVAAFALAWALSTVIENLYMAQRGLSEWRRRMPGVEVPLRWRSETLSEFPGFASFVNVVYWQSNLDLVSKRLSTLLIGGMLGAVGAGQFRIAREFSALLSTPALLLRQVLFPDFSRLWHRGGTGFGTLLARTLAGAAACGGIVVLVAAAAGEWILALLFGADYAAAAPVLVWLLVAGTLDLCTAVPRAAGYATGDAAAVLRINVVGTIAYVLLLCGLTPSLGLHGAGIASCAASAVALAGMLRLMWLRRLHLEVDAPAPVA